MSGMIQKLDAAFQGTRPAKFFKMEERGTTFSTEFRGAMATFMSMAYILAVNPRILSE